MAVYSTAANIKFTVRRRPAVLVPPASPTPRELKWLSDIDGQDSLRKHVSIIHFYENKQESSSMVVDKQEQDPAVVIRDAVARALVPFHPFAGRLRELDDGGKLAVDCTAEGVLFVEADADVRLEQFGAALLPPFPCVEELIFAVPGSSAIIDSPLLLFQVTRLACGGFILAVRLNHTMADGAGVKQFLDAVAELARGDARHASALTVRPVWERHLLDGRRRRNNPTTTTHHRQVTRTRTETDSSSSIKLLPSLAEGDKTMVVRSFFFGPDEMAAIRAQLSPELQAGASRFDVIAGWLWKCRTTALALDADEAALLVFARRRRPWPVPLPGCHPHRLLRQRAGTPGRRVHGRRAAREPRQLRRRAGEGGQGQGGGHGVHAVGGRPHRAPRQADAAHHRRLVLAVGHDQGQVRGPRLGVPLGQACLRRAHAPWRRPVVLAVGVKLPLSVQERQWRPRYRRAGVLASRGYG